MGSFFSLPTAVVVVVLAILFRPMSPQPDLRKPKTPAGDHQNVDWKKASKGAPKTVQPAINMNTIPLRIASLSLSLSHTHTHMHTHLLSYSLTHSISLFPLFFLPLLRKCLRIPVSCTLMITPLFPFFCLL